MNEPKKFQKNIEDFVCDHCGTKVIGNGYTNHCPHCLWSKHVDVHPGDRASDCLGAMRLMRLLKDGSEFIITHHCEICGHTKNNKISPDDNFERVIDLSTHPIDS